jgi:uncharacterized protein (TIGR02996 family)
MPPRAEMEQAFLDGIVAHPEEHELWLVLADWLEDGDDPRAELVRLTWSLQYEPDHADFETRQARMQALLAGSMKPVRPRMTLAGIDFAWIPPGTFLMGSPEDEAERYDRETQHPVTLSAGFWMGATPITQGQWKAVMGDSPSYFSRSGGGKEKVKKVSDADLARFSVDTVSWEMAQEFCTRLDQEVALPSEAQWEYACRAGTRTPFSFGATLNGKEANCDGKSPYGTKKKGPYLKRPSIVGSYPSNAWGLSDLHGNVWEWCQDAWREDLENLPEADPLFEQEGTSGHVLRGGSWNDVAQYCRSAWRNFDAPDTRNLVTGFRVIIPCRG